MKRALLIATLLILASCKINVDGILENQEPINIIIYGEGTNSKEYVLINTDQKYKLFKAWVANNKGGWEPTPASYVPSIIVKGSSFTFNFLNEGVIVNVDGIQYSKAVNKSEYDYLLQQNT